MKKPIDFSGVYDILVNEGGAVEDERESFLFAHPRKEYSEWRFCGKLGFGGKFRYDHFRAAAPIFVTCYPEDMNPEREALIKRINLLLSELV